jgi:hypothetical protein
MEWVLVESRRVEESVERRVENGASGPVVDHEEDDGLKKRTASPMEDEGNCSL